MKCLSVLILCAGLDLSAQGAHASPCANQIAQLETALKQSAAHRSIAVTGRQSMDAQLHHQPTPASVSRAREVAESDAADRLAKAKDLDSKGESAACLRIVGEVRSIVGP